MLQMISVAFCYNLEIFCVPFRVIAIYKVLHNCYLLFKFVSGALWLSYYKYDLKSKVLYHLQLIICLFHSLVRIFFFMLIEQICSNIEFVLFAYVSLRFHGLLLISITLLLIFSLVHFTLATELSVLGISQLLASPPRLTPEGKIIKSNK